MVDTPPQTDRRIKQFCPQKHDTFLTGRTKNRACRICVTLSSAARRNRSPEVHAAYLKKDAAHRNANRELYRQRGRNNNWKIAGILNADGSLFTTVDFDRAYQIQQGRCLGCGLHQSEFKHRLHADHNHKTGVFRFLLCNNCNRALGHGLENPIILRKLADLLEGK